MFDFAVAGENVLALFWGQGNTACAIGGLAINDLCSAVSETQLAIAEVCIGEHGRAESDFTILYLHTQLEEARDDVLLDLSCQPRVIPFFVTAVIGTVQVFPSPTQRYPVLSE